LGDELAELVNFGAVGKDADFQVEDALFAGLKRRQKTLLAHFGAG
jgi:hypothetical protein